MKKDKEGNTPFHLAAASGDGDTLDNFIRYYELETGTTEGDVTGKKACITSTTNSHYQLKMLLQFCSNTIATS